MSMIQCKSNDNYNKVNWIQISKSNDGAINLIAFAGKFHYLGAD